MFLFLIGPRKRVGEPAGNAELVVLLTEVFHQLVARRGELRVERHRERPGVRARVVNRAGVDQRAPVDAGPPPDGVQPLGMRRLSDRRP